MKVALTAVMIALGGCAVKSSKPVATAAPTPPGSLSTTREYVDLEPGWRLRIVAPVTKSGSYGVDTKAPEQSGNVITLKTSDDLIGYETALWAITARPGGGVSVHLSSAELTKNGVTAPIQTPSKAAVHVEKYARYLRIFYLTRRSGADHDMALVGAARFDRLEAFTRSLREAPADACANRPRDRIYCEWIPVGMAVRPEIPKTVGGVTRWVDRF